MLGVGTLTQKPLEVLGAAVLGPVRVLQVPDRPLLPREQVLHLQAGGGVAARVCAEPGGDLEPSVGDGVVPGTKAWPVPKALLPSALLLQTQARTVKTQRKAPKYKPFYTHRQHVETQTRSPNLPLSLSVRIPTGLTTTSHLRQSKLMERNEHLPLPLSPSL